MSGTPGRSTPARASCLTAALAALAVAAFLARADPAHAAQPRVSKAQAVQIAGAVQKLKKLVTENPGAYWQVLPRKNQWLVVLHPFGQQQVLASARIDN